MFHLFSIILSALITVSLIPLAIRVARRFQIVDHPDHRKIHTQPIPRVGGITMAIATFVSLLLWLRPDEFLRGYLMGTAVLVAFGLVDDLRGIGYGIKFGGQMLAALLAIFAGGVRIESLGNLLPEGFFLPPWFSVLLTLVTIVGVTNAINLADGLDGLAGGISLLIFCSIAYLAYLNEDPHVLILSLSLAGALFGFLRFNTHPAVLFMGDTGSQFLGFSAILLGLKITQSHTSFSPLLPLIILGFPVLDTLTVMVERLKEGRSPFSPDKRHFHHRLVHLGFPHTGAVMVIYLIQSLLSVSAILLKHQSEITLLLIYGIFSLGILAGFSWADRKGFRLRRYALIDDRLHPVLQKIRQEHWVIRISFPIFQGLTPAVFLTSCFFLTRPPSYLVWMAIGFFVYLIGVRIFVKGHLGFCLRFVLFLSTPLILYLIEGEGSAQEASVLFTLYDWSFGALVLLGLLVVKFTRRTLGFRVTPMDFLILFIAVAIPHLPDLSLQSSQIGSLSVKLIVLLFSYEVLIRELRGQWDRLIVPTLLGFLLIGSRGGFS